MVPKVRGSENGMTSNRKISNRLVNAVGFSNGCAEFAFRYPPPLVPSSLIASCEAISPPGKVCEPPVTVAISIGGLRFWITPDTTSTSAARNDNGNSTRRLILVTSTQKFPNRSVCRRISPRISAATTAIPTAADRKFCTVNPIACTV